MRRRRYDQRRRRLLGRVFWGAKSTNVINKVIERIRLVANLGAAFFAAARLPANDIALKSGSRLV